MILPYTHKHSAYSGVMSDDLHVRDSQTRKVWRWILWNWVIFKTSMWISVNRIKYLELNVFLYYPWSPWWLTVLEWRDTMCNCISSGLFWCLFCVAKDLWLSEEGRDLVLDIVSSVGAGQDMIIPETAIDLERGSKMNVAYGLDLQATGQGYPLIPEQMFWVQRQTNQSFLDLRVGLKKDLIKVHLGSQRKKEALNSVECGLCSDLN